jgi:hypothetical protein
MPVGTAETGRIELNRGNVMMHCHVCDEDVPLDEIANHVRLFHPHAWPIDHVDIAC